MKTKAYVIKLFGIVQGVGFRPFVSRTAAAYSVTGSVANKGSYVEVHAVGNEDNLTKFIDALKNKPPERALILKTVITASDEKPHKSFEITESEKETGDIFVSPDIAVCKKCKEELFDKNSGRYLHPFINCTACGPRLTILDSMPYDRERTSMGEFEMCQKCRFEYTHPETRRYDAQPVCCNDCGPTVYMIGRKETGAAAITLARKALTEGKIIAVKGIGGFHLCCDAKCSEAVKRLRALKNRPAKPFAVMLADLDEAKKQCEVLPVHENLLDGYQKPIILFKKRKDSTIAEEVAPENPNIGVMLPYAPLQLLLFKYDDDVKDMTKALVMTSGNISGAPICRDDNDALNELSGFCDLLLSHNRKIRLSADDSVMSIFEDKPYMIRRSRGFAPLPMILSNNFSGEVLAIGGELKNTFCIAKNELFYLSPYIGDMADIRTVNALKESVTRMETLLEAKPKYVACDLHPGYNSVAAAKNLGLEVIAVQHHFAHIASCLAENDYSGEVIGVSFDGTGLGTDGTIWGGELMTASFAGFTRAGSIRPFLHVGGDSASREGYKIAVSMINSLYGEKSPDVISALNLCSPKEANVISVMAKNKINTVVSTSAGRLFDAVSAVLGVKRASTFEGEASMSLEFTAESYKAADSEINAPFPLVSKEDKVYLNTDLLFKYIVFSALGGENPQRLAYIFHLLLSKMIAAACCEVRKDSDLDICALSGGVFQNTLLLSLTKKELEDAGFKVLIHSLVPPNDGGIALGQAAVAMSKIRDK